MTTRITGPLGDTSWALTVADVVYNCHECGRSIESGAACYAKDFKRRHMKCQMKARHASMSPAEQEEMWLRVLEATLGADLEQEEERDVD